MAEEQQQGEMSEQDQAQENTGMVQISAVELAKIRKGLKDSNAEAARYRKEAEQAEIERKAKQEAEMTELEKVAKRAAELEAQLQRLTRENLQREIAAKVGLPAKLATRLQGENAEEMEADAKAILEDLPKPPKPQPGPVANPGTNGREGETLSQQLARIHGQSNNVWDTDIALKKGGGVVFPPDK